MGILKKISESGLTMSVREIKAARAKHTFFPLRSSLSSCWDPLRFIRLHIQAWMRRPAGQLRFITPSKSSSFLPWRILKTIVGQNHEQTNRDSEVLRGFEQDTTSFGFASQLSRAGVFIDATWRFGKKKTVLLPDRCWVTLPGMTIAS